MKILIIDDDQVSRTIVSKLLAKEKGNEISELASAEEAIEKLADGLLPDLVILDLVLPEMSGEDLLKKLREETRWKELPVIVCSSSANRESIGRLARLRIRGYLLKPIVATRLRELVREVARDLGTQALLESAETVIQRLDLTLADYLELLELFSKEAGRLLGEMKTIAEAGEKPKLVRQLEALRAMAGNVGALATAAGAEKVADQVESAEGKQLVGMIAQLELDKQRTDAEIKKRTDAAKPKGEKGAAAPVASAKGEAGDGKPEPAGPGEEKPEEQGAGEPPPDAEQKAA